MTHLIGQMVLQYRIVEHLGEGGMGVVYKAEDTKLRRTVALKFLPHDIASRESERDRFLQEAQAAALLNHPNICTVYDILDHGGEQFIVMEYVEGKTLRQMVPVGNLQEAVNYAVQIGEALKEAHGNGVVHRDIKTDNIMVNSKNQVKVMDFGLAKLRGSIKLTKTRSTVGTLAYMAPEQIQGGQVDARSDIFSFGVVLFEMLTGQLPFKGEHEAGMMYSILNDRPQDLKVLRSDTPSELEHIIFRCLEKEPEDRYQGIAELSVELRRLKKQTGPVHTGGTDRPHQTSGLATEPERRLLASRGARSKTFRFAVIGLFLIIGVGLFLILAHPHTPTVNPDMTIRTISVPFPDFDYGGLSPDGNWVVLSRVDEKGLGGLVYLNTSSNQWQMILQDSIEPYIPDISPDGSRVCYQGRDFELYVIGVLASSPRSLGVKGGIVHWNRHGTRILYSSQDERHDKPYLCLWSINPDGTDRRLEFIDSLRSSIWPFSFDSSPDGNEIAYERTFPDGTTEIIRRDLRTGRERQLTSERSWIDDICWLNNGMLVFSCNKAGTLNIWCMPADGGPLKQISRGSGSDIGSRATIDANHILYTQTSSTGELRAISLTRKKERLLNAIDAALDEPFVSPDGKTVLYGVREHVYATTMKIYRSDIEGHNSREIAEVSGLITGIVWSPRGKLASCEMELRDGSTVSKILDVSSGAVRDTFRNASITWLSEDSLVVNTRSRALLAVPGKQTTVQLPRDSVKIWPIPGKPFFLYFDRRASKSGVLWLCEGSCLDSASFGRATAILLRASTTKQSLVVPEEPFIVKPYSAVVYILETVGTGMARVYRVSLPDLTIVRIPKELPWDSRDLTKPDFTPDGQEALYKAIFQHSKLNMISNPFK